MENPFGYDTEYGPLDQYRAYFRSLDKTLDYAAGLGRDCVKELQHELDDLAVFIVRAELGTLPSAA